MQHSSRTYHPPVPEPNFSSTFQNLLLSRGVACGVPDADGAASYGARASRVPYSTQHHSSALYLDSRHAKYCRRTAARCAHSPAQIAAALLGRPSLRYARLHNPRDCGSPSRLHPAHNPSPARPCAKTTVRRNRAPCPPPRSPAYSTSARAPHASSLPPIPTQLCLHTLHSRRGRAPIRRYRRLSLRHLARAVAAHRSPFRRGGSARAQ